MEIPAGDNSIRLKFTVGDKTSTHLYQDPGGIAAIAQLGGLASGQHVNFASFPHTQRSYLIGLGESFAVQTVDRRFLIGKIRSIKARRDGDDKDEVCFAFIVASNSTGDLRAL